MSAAALFLARTKMLKGNPQLHHIAESESLGCHMIRHTVIGFEMYIWGNESNYTKNKAMGKLAHLARVELDLFLSRKGLDNYLDFYRACFKVGLGRNLSVILKFIE